MATNDDFGEFMSGGLQRYASPPPAHRNLEQQGSGTFADLMAMGALIGSFDAALKQLQMGVSELCSIYGLDNAKPLDDELAKVDCPEDALQHLASSVRDFLERTKAVGSTMSKLATTSSMHRPAADAPSFRQSRFNYASSWRGDWLKRTVTASEQHNGSPSAESLGVGGESVTSLAFTDANETSVANVNRDDEGNKIINNYQVEAELGRGSFGKVKLAIHRHTDKVVAIKILNKSLLRKARTGMLSAFDQVRAEIAIMKKLKHRNIVRLYEVIDDPDSNKLYLVMQYIEEGPIHHIDPNTGTCVPLPEEKVKSIARQLISGLHYLHRHNVVHRDLKPENVLRGQDGTIYLSDFGVSEIVDDETEELTGCQGTPTFFSPELCRGEGAVHGKMVDLWALGVTLYALLLGKLPFFGASIEEVMHRIQNCEVHFPDDTPQLWRDVLGGLLNKDPRKRTSLLELKHHEWLTGVTATSAASPSYIRSRRMSEFDVVTIDDDDLAQAIAVGNRVRLTTHATPRERVGKFVRRIRERVRGDENAANSSQTAAHATWSGPHPPSSVPPHRARASTTVTFHTSPDDEDLSLSTRNGSKPFIAFAETEP